MANTAGTATSTTPRQPHKIGDVPRGVGSPLDRHPSNHEHWGEGDHRSTPEYWALMKKVQDHTQKTYNWYNRLKQLQSSMQRPSSRKRERQVVPKPPTDMPTQSPLQKSGRLQSVVSVVKREQPKDRGTSRDPDDDIPTRWHSDRTFESAPYHLCGSLEEDAEPFVLYITDRFGREEFKDKVEDFGNVFGHRTTFVARFCMATAVYFEVTWVRGYQWVFPNIPPEMERMTSW